VSLPTFLLLVAATAVVVASLGGPLLAEESRPAYPPTRRSDAVDEYPGGAKVPDPYRWLEPDDDPEVAAWDEAQNALLRKRLDAVPEREELRRRLDAELALGGSPSLPTFRGGKRWFTHLLPGKDQPILFVQDEEGTSPPRVVIDPNPWSAGGTEAFKSWSVSPDGRYVVYERMSKGSENTTSYVRDVQTGKDLPDVLPRTKFASFEWSADGRGLYYDQLPPPDAVPAGEAEYHSRVRYHRLGTLPADDPIVFGEGRAKLESYGVRRSRDDRHLFVVGGFPYKAIDTYEVEETPTGRAIRPVLVGHDSRTWLDRSGDVLLLNTDHLAPRRRLCVARPGEANDPATWREVFPQEEGVVQDAVLVRHGAFEGVLVHVARDVVSHLLVIGLDGTRKGEIALPGPGTVGEEIRTKPGDSRVWFTFESMDVPLTSFVVDLAKEGWPLTAEARVPTTVDTSVLATTKTSYASRDGTRIPIFLLHRKDVAWGTAPVVLHGYGGFRVGMNPRFGRARAIWVERGGVWATACLRGGDEFGEAWHEAGMLGNKQNVFDDFVAGADWLVSTERASRDRLAIWGGSNGGLLVAACANQRPDLAKAVVCSVPLTDMLRYHRFQYAEMWAAEYGNPDEVDAFAWIRAYSPYHNVKDGTPYPATLVTAGLGDSRVNAFHARKIVARWQEATSSPAPVLLYLDREGGHGAAGVSRWKMEILDQLCFLHDVLRR
jgi:prolyl oligopeptidase